MVKRPIDAFVKYFLDVKPYHTKILEIVEQYLFKDDINITIQESSFFHEQFINDPACKPLGFGLDYDDECGFSSPSCCTTFDCVGGFGLVYDNYDLLVSAPVLSVDEVTHSLTLDGDFRYDTLFNIKELTNSTITVYGDARGLLDLSHSLFLISPVSTLDILEVTANGFWVYGNYSNDLEFVNEVTVHRSQGNDGVYSVTGTSYDNVTNRTFISVQQSADLFQGLYNNNGNGELIFDSNTKNNGVYKKSGYVYQAPSTTTPELTTILLDSETPILIPTEVKHGSVLFKTGYKQGRQVWLNDGTNDFLTMSETKIVDVSFEFDEITGNPLTTIIISIASSNGTAAEESIDLTQNFLNLVEEAVEGSLGSQDVPFTSTLDLSSISTVELRGYFFDAGFDAETECQPPVHNVIQAGFSEYLWINLFDPDLYPTPTPDASPTTPTPTPTPVTPTPTPVTPTPTPTPSAAGGNLFSISYDTSIPDSPTPLNSTAAWVNSKPFIYSTFDTPYRLDAGVWTQLPYNTDPSYVGQARALTLGVESVLYGAVSSGFAMFDEQLNFTNYQYPHDVDILSAANLGNSVLLSGFNGDTAYSDDNGANWAYQQVSSMNNNLFACVIAGEQRVYDSVTYDTHVRVEDGAFGVATATAGIPSGTSPEFSSNGTVYGALTTEFLANTLQNLYTSSDGVNFSLAGTVNNFNVTGDFLVPLNVPKLGGFIFKCVDIFNSTIVAISASRDGTDYTRVALPTPMADSSSITPTDNGIIIYDAGTGKWLKVDITYTG